MFWQNALWRYKKFKLPHHSGFLKSRNYLWRLIAGINDFFKTRILQKPITRAIIPKKAG
jgi:hypothetical protein